MHNNAMILGGILFDDIFHLNYYKREVRKYGKDND